MDTDAAILNVFLYGVWLGLPIVIAALILLGVGREPQPGGMPSALQQFLPVIFVASALTILLDILLVPSLEFRRLVYSAPWMGQLLRVLFFPLCVVAGRGVALAAAMIKPAEVDPRFQSELKGISPIWAVLGYAAAIVMLFARGAPSNPHEGGLQGYILKPQTVETDGSQPASAGVIYDGVNYERFKDLIPEYAAKYDIAPGILMALVAEESNFNAEARGIDGGVGLLNVTANMARQMGVEDYLSPAGNLDAGTAFLRSLRELFGPENPRLWIAAYHFGTKRIQDDPTVIEHDPDVKLFVDSVMRKTGSAQ